MPYTYKYPRPMVSVDIVVFALATSELQVLLVQRKSSPYKNRWALPGGFVEMEESLDEAAQRELREETHLGGFYLEQLYSFGAVNRDPRGRVITVAYYALVNQREHHAQAASDAAEAQWFGISGLPFLAFDHQEILQTAHARLQAKVRYQPIGFELLPKKFTLRELQHLYEIVLGRELDKRNFRKKILNMDLLMGLDETESNVARRPAQLFRFDKRKYDRWVKQGFNFEI